MCFTDNTDFFLQIFTLKLIIFLINYFFFFQNIIHLAIFLFNRKQQIIISL